MGVLQIVKTAKQIHNHHVILIKTGGFYHVYGRDSYILSYMFGYKLKQMEENYTTCGFPESTINKVMAGLENKKISYILLDRKNNYETDKKESFKNLNNYEKLYEKARKYIVLKKRIDNIYEILQERIDEGNFKELLNKLEEDIYEGRKV